MNPTGYLAREFEQQVNAVRSYLRSEMPKTELIEEEDFKRDGVMFRIEPHRAIFISHEFLNHFDAGHARTTLKRFGVGAMARRLQAGYTLIVSTDGAFLEPVREIRGERYV